MARRLVPLDDAARAALAAAVCVMSIGGCGAGRPPRNDGDDGGDARAGVDAAAGGDSASPPERRVIMVTTTEVNELDDGLCSLSEAIAASNGHAAVNTDDCPAGAGNDVIQLPAGVYRVPGALLPSETMEIRGAGVGRSVLSFDDNPLSCGVSFSAGDKTLWLTSLTLTAAVAPPSNGLTGACVTDGVLRVRHVRVNGFGAGGLAARAAPGASAKIEVLNGLIDGNRSHGDGAGVAFVGPGSWIAVDQSAIVNNASDGMGGGVFGSGWANANYIVNTTISGNTARLGGGVASRVGGGGYMALYWSTVADNHALETGGGLHVLVPDGDLASTIVVGAIIADNVADADTGQSNLNADWTSNLSCTFSIFGVSALATQPPMFMDSCQYDDALDVKLGPLMDMGGADHLPIHALLAGSPAIDAIDEDHSFEMVEQRDTWHMASGDPPLGDGPGETPAWTVYGRTFDGDPLEDMGAYEFNPRWEAELLAVVSVAAAGHEVVTAPDGYSQGAGTRLGAEAAGAQVTYQVPVPEAGRYDVAIRTRTASDAGTFQLSIADVSADAGAGPYVPVGDAQDGYASSDGWQTTELGTVDFAAAGQKLFRFDVGGKNDASAGYNLFLDYIEVKRAAGGYSLPSFAGGFDFYLTLPPSFSPFLPLYGEEATREPPGFHDQASPEYFSYSFLWWLTGAPDLSTAALRDDLRNYFVGLCGAAAAAVTVTLDEPQGDPTGGGTLVARRNGTLDAGACFGATVPTAAIELSTYRCPDHAAVQVLVSPRPAADPVWDELHAVREGFACW